MADDKVKLGTPAACQLSDEELKKKLSPEQFKILKKNGTEAPFANDYWNNKRRGLYVDVISGEPLFSSEDKFDSGSGWPSFTKALKPEAVQKKSDTSHGMQRIEVRSAKSDSHLGHVFDDGPKDRGGLRYCINSASLRFVPYEELDAQGYAAWKPVFDSPKK